MIYVDTLPMIYIVAITLTYIETIIMIYIDTGSKGQLMAKFVGQCRDQLHCLYMHRHIGCLEDNLHGLYGDNPIVYIETINAML